MVLAWPARESWSSCVSLESRKGMWADLEARACITLPVSGRGRKEGVVGLRGPECHQTRASKPCTAHRSACRSAGRSLRTGRRHARRSAARSRRCISLSVGPTPAPSPPGPTPAPPSQPTQGGQGLVDVLRLHQLLALRAALPDALRPGQVDEVEAGVGACAGVQVLALHQDGQHCLKDLYRGEGKEGDAGSVRGACDDPAAIPSWRRHGRTLYCRTQPPCHRKPLPPRTALPRPLCTSRPNSPLTLVRAAAALVHPRLGHRTVACPQLHHPQHVLRALHRDLGCGGGCG